MLHRARNDREEFVALTQPLRDFASLREYFFGLEAVDAMKVISRKAAKPPRENTSTLLNGRYT